MGKSCEKRFPLAKCLVRLLVHCWLLFSLPTTVVRGVVQETEQLPSGPGQKPFDVTRHSVPLKEIKSGRVTKDGIPALIHPAFVSAKEGDKFLLSWNRVLGVTRDGISKAYPIKILNWHEVVSDTIADTPIVISY